MTTTHTPTPWIWGTAAGSPHHYIYREDQKAGEDGIALVGDQADAELIVKAVNRDPLFEELVEALGHLVAANNTNYTLGSMRYAGYFDAAEDILAKIIKVNA